MRLFDCDHCGQSVHFDNRQCVRCGYRLGFVPDRLAMFSLEPDLEPNWHLVAEPARSVRFCSNASLDICNWMVDVEDDHEFCIACRHNRLVPNADTQDGIDRW